MLANFTISLDFVWADISQCLNWRRWLTMEGEEEDGGHKREFKWRLIAKTLFIETNKPIGKWSQKRHRLMCALCIVYYSKCTCKHWLEIFETNAFNEHIEIERFIRNIIIYYTHTQTSIELNYKWYNRDTYTHAAHTQCDAIDSKKDENDVDGTNASLMNDKWQWIVSNLSLSFSLSLSYYIMNNTCVKSEREPCVCMRGCVCICYRCNMNVLSIAIKYAYEPKSNHIHVI